MSLLLRGKAMDRRRFLSAGAAMLATPLPLDAQPGHAALSTRRLNNVMIAVSNLDCSVAFYQKLFGPAVMDGDTALIRIGDGPHFLGITQAKNGAELGFLSYGLTVADFDPARVQKAIAGIGFKAQSESRNGTPEVWTADPDAIKIQLQHVAYGHGAGLLGAVLPPAPLKGAPAFHLKTISHVTVTNSSGPKSLDFYGRMFGWPVQSKQGPAIWAFAIGEGLDCVVFNVTANNPAAKAGINHTCFTLPGFDANTVMNILADNGMEPIEYGNAAAIKPLTCRTRLRQRANNGGGPGYWLGTPEVYFNDPDNIAMQLQDVSYCGGSGLQGEVCS
jgi:catechol 2,3-dioxygenase-like lactoylglutathione lyase family enzyme